MRVLIACEFSGVVRRAFRERGHDAWSCDLLPAEDGSEFHLQCDVLTVLNRDWQILIGHPPCTFLTNAGVRHLYEHVAGRAGGQAKISGPARMAAMKEGAAFFLSLLNAPVERVCIENPIPHKYARALIGPYTQCLQPWMFGDGEQKAVCLWLRGLPKLERTHRKGDLFCAEEPKERVQRVHKMSPGPNRAKERSRFFPGVAAAMAAQWGEFHSIKQNQKQNSI